MGELPMMQSLWQTLLNALSKLLPSWGFQSIGEVIGSLLKIPPILNWINGGIRMLWNLLKPSGVLGVLTAAGAVFLAIMSISAWIREDAIRDNDQAWELKIAKKNQELHNKVGEQNLKLAELERKLIEADQALAAATELNRRALEKQRVSVPLSEACTACRVPNERLWLR